MQLKHALVLHGDNHCFENTTLSIESNVITAIGAPTTDDAFDMQGLYVLPGMIDTHLHGFAGTEFACLDGEFSHAQTVLANDGVTGFAATVRCMAFDDMCACETSAVNQMAVPSSGTKCLGIHLEGPFVSTARAGAMFPPDIPCTVEAMDALIAAAAGHLRLMTIAPERENAMEIIAHATSHGVTCSLGHTDATYDQARGGVDAGATRATHVFNAMRPFYHRETGVLGEVLTDDRVTCEMIADFVHLDPAVINLILRTKGASNITLISDAGVMSGLPNGDYIVGGRKRTVKDGVCLDAAGRIAGSCYSMLKGAQNLRTLGVSLEDIAVMASENPAKALGMFDTVGSIDRGKCADLIVCDDAFNIHAVIIDGRFVRNDLC